MHSTVVVRSLAACLELAPNAQTEIAQQQAVLIQQPGRGQHLPVKHQPHNQASAAGIFYQASAGSACGASSVRRLNGMLCLQDIDTGSVQERHYGSVIAACGHHWDPLWPELKGEFGGTMSHAHSYRSPKPFEGRRVLIIGGGNSGGVFLQLT